MLRFSWCCRGRTCLAGPIEGSFCACSTYCVWFCSFLRSPALLKTAVIMTCIIRSRSIRSATCDTLLTTSIQLGTSHNLLRQSGQWVEVTWKGVQDPQDDDYIALYAPANVSIYETSPVKYQWAVKAASHRTHGAGSIRFATVDLLLNLFTHLNMSPGPRSPSCIKPADNGLYVSSRFRLLNLRTDMRIAFVRNGFEFPVVAAWGDIIRVANVNEPLQGHLALTGENRYQ